MVPPETSVVDEDIEGEEKGFDVLDAILMLARRWHLVVGLALGFGLVAYVCGRALEPRYLAQVSFLVDLGQGGGSATSFFRSADPTVALLSSKSISQIVVTKATPSALQRGRDKLSLEEMQSLVLAETSVARGADNVYSLSVLDPYPDRAVLIANTFLEALQELGDRMSFETAARSRAYFETQMDAERRELDRAELALKAAQERTGLLQPGSQTGIEIGQIASLRSQITALQVQRATMAQSATPDNPEMVRLNAQMNELQARVNSLQQRISSAGGTALPSENLELARLGREVAYHEGLVSSFSDQYEHARMQETYNVPRLRVIDRAALPIPRTYPRPLALAGFAAVTGFLLGFALILGEQIFRKLNSDPESSLKLRALGRAVRGRA